MAFHEFDLDLPKKIKIGLTAANISAKPLKVTFENFADHQRHEIARFAVRRDEARRKSKREQKRPTTLLGPSASSRSLVSPPAHDGELRRRARPAWRLPPVIVRDGRAAGIHPQRNRMPARRERRASPAVTPAEAAVSSIQSRTPAAESASTLTAPPPRHRWRPAGTPLSPPLFEIASSSGSEPSTLA